MAERKKTTSAWWSPAIGVLWDRYKYIRWNRILSLTHTLCKLSSDIPTGVKTTILYTPVRQFFLQVHYSLQAVQCKGKTVLYNVQFHLFKQWLWWVLVCSLTRPLRFLMLFRPSDRIFRFPKQDTQNVNYHCPKDLIINKYIRWPKYDLQIKIPRSNYTV